MALMGERLDWLVHTECPNALFLDPHHWTGYIFRLPRHPKGDAFGMAGKHTDGRALGNRTFVPDLDGCVVRSGIEEVRGIAVGIGNRCRGRAT